MIQVTTGRGLSLLTKNVLVLRIIQSNPPLRQCVRRPGQRAPPYRESATGSPQRRWPACQFTNSEQPAVRPRAARPSHHQRAGQRTPARHGGRASPAVGVEEWRAWRDGVGRGPEVRGGERGSGVLDARPPAPPIISGWRLKEKLTCGAHTSVRERKLVDVFLSNTVTHTQIIRLTCGPIRL
jgi:hypothetical protein